MDSEQTYTFSRRIVRLKRILSALHAGRQWRRTMAVCLMALSVGACTAVMQSGGQYSTANLGRCTSQLGSYQLPKTHIVVTVVRDVSSAGNPYMIQQIDPRTRADRRFSFCLDYLASPFADDIIQVDRGKAADRKQGLTSETNKGSRGATPFLQLVTSNAVDQTALVVRKLIRTIFVGISQNPNFQPASRADRLQKGSNFVVEAELEFDPFDAKEVAEVNQRLRQMGFCVALENYNYDEERVRPGTYCSHPVATMRQHPPPAAAILDKQSYLVPAAVRGIHYRPKAHYILRIYSNDDPAGGGFWRLMWRQALKLENISPIIALGVDRAIFAQRRTALIFNDGVLQQLCISKSSEIEGFIEIPLEVVYGLVALPSQILQIKIDSTTNNRLVAEAEHEVIKSQERLIAYRQTGVKPDPTIPDGGSPKGSLTGGTKSTTAVFVNGAPPAATEITKHGGLKDICDAVKAGGDI
ncbi:MAG: hypothetical protein AAGD43_03875 [Pseudomonadota bacterium]